MPDWLKRAAAFLCVVTAIVAAQQLIRARRGDPGEFTAIIDEPSHFVTALMIRDYVARGLPGSPIAFAKDYYLHYPKVAFGSWPPLLHICLGGWMLLLPPSRHSAVLYMDVLMASLALLSAVLARRRLPLPVSAAVGVATWLAPVTQSLDQAIQADLQYALFSAACVWLFALYLERPNGRRAAAFGLALMAAVMTKNNGLFLALSLPLIVVLTSSYGVLRRLGAWLAVLPAVIAVIVWQYFTLPFVSHNMTGVTEDTTPGLVVFAYLGQLGTLIWPVLLPFALWGVYRVVWGPLGRRELQPFDAALVALLVGPVAFHSLLPHGVNQRYLLPSLPPLLVFTGVGILDLLSLPAWGKRRRTVCAGVASLLVALPALAGPVERMPRRGFTTVAERLVSLYPANRYPSILVESSFGGEANLVAEIAVRDQRPGRWLLRGIKLLRHKTGSFNRQTSLVETDPAAMLQYWKSLPVSLLVISNDEEEQQADRDYLARVMRVEPALFTPVMSVPCGEKYAADCTIQVYKLETSGAAFAPEKLPSGMPLWPGL